MCFVHRIQNKLWDEEQKKAGELAACRVNLQAVKNWIELRDKELESMDPIGNDLDTLSRQKEDLKVRQRRKVCVSSGLQRYSACFSAFDPTFKKFAQEMTHLVTILE